MTIEAKAITLNFKVNVTEANINILRRLYEAPAINIFSEEEDNEFEVGDEVNINYSLEGELSDTAVSIAMLFNGNLVGKPLINLSRG